MFHFGKNVSCCSCFRVSVLKHDKFTVVIACLFVIDSQYFSMKWWLRNPQKMTQMDYYSTYHTLTDCTFYVVPAPTIGMPLFCCLFWLFWLVLNCFVVCRNSELFCNFIIFLLAGTALYFIYHSCVHHYAQAWPHGCTLVLTTATSIFLSSRCCVYSF